jgi:hypothetical protein
MMNRFHSTGAGRVAHAIAATLLVSAMAPWASAAFVFNGDSADGHPVSGIADFALDAAADTITVTLTNTTANSFDAGELLTGLDFSVGGLVPSLVSDLAIRRTIALDGSFADTGAPQNLTWSLVTLGDDAYQLNFHGDAKDSIVGPPMAGSYATANRSIRGNPGHNPFAAETAAFVLSVPDLEDDTPVNVLNFRYGTDLESANGNIPEPSSLVLAAVGLFGLLAWARRRGH